MNYNLIIPDIINECAGDVTRGMTKPEIWKAVSSRHAIADQKMFTVRLKKLVDTGALELAKGKYKLSKGYMEKRVKQLEKGNTEGKVVSKSKASMKKAGKLKVDKKKATKRATKKKQSQKKGQQSKKQG